MQKFLHTDDTLNTPFISTKEWNLSNVNNTDLIELEHNENTVALEFVDYTPTIPIFDDGCNIASEQQILDRAIYRYGMKGSGIFYPDQEPTNRDGTFQRVVYSQIITMFYNTYRDPTKMWGMEKLDFDLSKTKKFITDKFSVIDVPTSVFGQKMLENTVVMINNRSDNEYVISDDGNNNLFAGTNLFSHQQEIGDFSNVFNSGSNIECSWYLDFTVPKDPYALTASQVGYELTISLNWLDGPADGFVVERSYLPDTDNWEFISSNWENRDMLWNTGSAVVTPFTIYAYTAANVTNFYDTNVSYEKNYCYRVYAFNIWGTSSFTNIACATPVTSSPPPPPPTPSAPINLTVTSGSAILNWDSASSDQDYYRIQRSMNGTVYSDFDLSVPNTYTDVTVVSSPSPGTTYWYQVAAVNVYGISNFSNTASITFIEIPPAPPPGPPAFCVAPPYQGYGIHGIITQPEIVSN